MAYLEGGRSVIGRMFESPKDHRSLKFFFMSVSDDSTHSAPRHVLLRRLLLGALRSHQGELLKKDATMTPLSLS